jgi:hypothetical protein
VLEDLSLRLFGEKLFQMKSGYQKRMPILKKKREVQKKGFGIYKKRPLKNGLLIINQTY